MKKCYIHKIFMKMMQLLCKNDESLMQPMCNLRSEDHTWAVSECKNTDDTVETEFIFHFIRSIDRCTKAKPISNNIAIKTR